MYWIIYWPDLVAWMERSEKLAGWAQFFGGLLAVCAAWGFAAGEAKRARVELDAQRSRDIAQQEREDAAARSLRCNLLMAAKVLCDHAALVVETSASSLAGKSNDSLRTAATYAVADLVGIEAQLMAFPIHQLSSSTAIEHMAFARTAAISARLGFSVLAARKAVGPLASEDIRAFDCFVEVLEQASKDLVSEQVLLGS